MKAVILFTALVSITSSSAIPAPRGLQEDFQDFLALVPVEKLAKLALDYYEHDKEVQDAFAYLHSKEFSTVWDQLFAVKEVTNLLNYLEDAGLEVYEALNFVADFFGLNHVKPIRSVHSCEYSKIPFKSSKV